MALQWSEEQAVTKKDAEFRQSFAMFLGFALGYLLQPLSVGSLLGFVFALLLIHGIWNVLERLGWVR